MTGTWGGKREGSGRKRKETATTRRERSLSAKLRYRLARLQREEDAHEYAKNWLNISEPEILRRAMDCGDMRIMLEVWKEMRRYAYGSPTSRIEIEAGPSPLAVMQEILRERREREKAPAVIETSAKALPA